MQKGSILLANGTFSLQFQDISMQSRNGAQGALTHRTDHAGSLVHRSLDVDALRLRGKPNSPERREGRSGATRCAEGPSGPPGPGGPAGPAGAPGTSGTVIRFVDSECRQVCFVACEENERILSSHATNQGGNFTFDSDDRKATFRPQRQGVPVKVVLACVQK
jgi:hypothetical protein